MVSGLLVAIASCSDRPMTAGGSEGEDAAPKATVTPDAAADPLDGPVGQDVPPDAAAALDGGAERPSADDTSPSAQFRKIYETTLMPTCGGAGRFCHANELQSTKLDFNTLEKAYANLVNRPTALKCAMLDWPPILVVPFDPKASALMYVRGDICGLRHGSFIHNADLTAIEAWILAGAR